MSRKNRKSQQFGNTNRLADQGQDRAGVLLRALKDHVNLQCFQLTVEFEQSFRKLGLRTVGLNILFDAINEHVVARSVYGGHLVKCFDSDVLRPLRELCEKVLELHTEAIQSEQSQMRSLLRSAASADESNFGKMLDAFAQKVEAIINLNQHDANGRQAITSVLDATNSCAARGELIKQRIIGQKIAGGVGTQPGLEQTLDELVRQTTRELANEESALHSREELEKRWEELERLLESYRQEKRNFVSAHEEYSAHARNFFLEHDQLCLYKGEWHRQKETIRHAEAFFQAADIDPFDLSDKLVGTDRTTVLTMPDEQERASLEAETPNPFPQLQENRLEERVQNVIKEILALIGAFDEPSLPVPGETCPVTLVELAVCTYAAFVARYSNGKPYATSGRTTRKVFEGILTPVELTYGCTKDQFNDAVEDAESSGLMRHFKRQSPGSKIWNFCYQPTVQGFAYADTLYEKLPADFRDRIIAQHEALHQKSATFRREYAQRKQQTKS